MDMTLMGMTLMGMTLMVMTLMMLTMASSKEVIQVDTPVLIPVTAHPTQFTQDLMMTVTVMEVTGMEVTGMEAATISLAQMMILIPMALIQGGLVLVIEHLTQPHSGIMVTMIAMEIAMETAMVTATRILMSSLTAAGKSTGLLNMVFTGVLESLVATGYLSVTMV